MSVVPVNYRRQDASAEAIARDVSYALSIAGSYVQRVPGGAAGLVGRRVLELGPGHSLGTAVVLACHGAHVTATDRYLAPWDATYHPAFFAALLARLSAERRDLSPAPLLALLAAGDFLPPALAPLHLGVEDLGNVPAGSFDLVVSNAVFEHVEDVPRALDGLARITRRGGLGIHQVDFRDHRDFSRPLEYLTLAEEDFRREFTHCRGECGNRWRHSGMGASMRRAGFEVLDFEANMFAEPHYLADLRPRLHREQRGLDEDSLSILSGCFVLRRGPPAARPSRRATATDTAHPAGEDGGGGMPRPPVGDRAGETPAACPDGDADERARQAFIGRLAAGRRVLEVRCGGAEGSGPVEGRLAWNPAQGLRHPDGSADLVTCVDGLDAAADPAALVHEVRRVLADDGVALFGVPAREPAAAVERLVALLADFEWVEFFVQVSATVAAVLPLEGGAARSLRGSLAWQGGARLDDPSASAVLALCRRSRPVDESAEPLAAFVLGPPSAPIAQVGQVGQAARVGDAAQESALASELSAELQAQFAAANRLRWAALDAGLTPPA